MPRRFGLKLVPQDTGVDTLRRFWRIGDRAGFDHLWTYDHFAAIGPDPSLDTYEGWMLLATMAEVVEHARIGCMVSSATFRHPVVLAKMATTVDHLSGGRLEFGLGAGWMDYEHESSGIDLGRPGARLDRLEEACHVITSLWTKSRVTFTGEHYRLADATHNPKPLQRPRPPIWIGGSGRRRTLRIAAEYADAWNVVAETGEGTQDTERFAELSAVLDGHCAEVGRDPGAIRRTVQIFLTDADIAEQATIVELVERYVGVGADDVILVVPGAGLDDAAGTIRNAEAVAATLPALRELS